MKADSFEMSQSALGVFKELFLNPGKAGTYKNLALWASNNGYKSLAQLAEKESVQPEESESEFNRLCIGPYKLVVVPYESYWMSSDKALNGAIAADVSDFYAAAGLSSNSALNEYPDFFGNELEFLYFLEELEKEQQKLNALQVVRDIRGLSDSFRKKHFDNWSALFLTKLADETNSEFWQQAALVLKDVLYKGQLN